MTLFHEAYAEMVLKTQVAEHVQSEELLGLDAKRRDEHRGMFWHDSTDIHNGKKDGEKIVEHKGKKLDGREYLWTALNQCEAKVNPGYTSKRPNDQPSINYMLKWRYKEELEDILKLPTYH